MQKNLTILIFIIANLSAIGQQLNKDIKKYKLEKVKTVTVQVLKPNYFFGMTDTSKYIDEIKYINKNGQCIKKINYREDGSVADTFNYSLDINGNEINVIAKSNGKIGYYNSYSYDKSGRKATWINRMRTLDPSDDVLFKYSYKLDEKQQIKAIYEISYGDTISKKIFRYDSLGNNIETLILSGINGRDSMTYNSNKQLIEKKDFYYDIHGQHLHHIDKYFYNDKGLLEKTMVYRDSVSLSEIVLYKYEYYK